MFHQRDYIMRLIEQLGRALSQLVSRIRGGSVEEMAEADSELNGIAFQAGLDLELARRLSPDSLRLMYAPMGEVDPSRCWLLAELLYLAGSSAERKGDGEGARHAFVLALQAFREVRPEWRAEISLPDPSARIADLEVRLLAPPGEAQTSVRQP